MGEVFFSKAISSVSSVPEPTIVTDGLVLHVDAGDPNSYPGSGNTWFDISGNNFNGNLINGVGFSNNNGGILTFDGNNDYIEFNSFVSTYNNLNDFSATIWVRSDYTNPTSRGEVLMSSHTSSNSNNFRWQVHSNFVFLADITDGGDTYYNHSTLSSATWHHYAITVDNSTNTIRIYLDGSQIDTDGFNSFTSQGNSNRFSFGQEFDSAISELFQGAMSNAQLYNRVLNVGEIQQNYDAFKDRFGL